MNAQRSRCSMQMVDVKFTLGRRALFRSAELPSMRRPSYTSLSYCLELYNSRSPYTCTTRDRNIKVQVLSALWLWPLALHAHGIGSPSSRRDT